MKVRYAQAETTAATALAAVEAWLRAGEEHFRLMVDGVKNHAAPLSDHLATPPILVRAESCRTKRKGIHDP